MKKLIAVLAVALMASTSMALVDYNDSVHWTGTGDWMNTNNWTETSGLGSDWTIPGWVVGNPINTNLSTDVDWNNGYAHIDSGTVNVTSGSNPDGTVRSVWMGSNVGNTTLNISDDITIREKFYMGYESTASDVATVNQTAGNVVIGTASASRTYFGRGLGQSVYNLSGGTLTTGGDWNHFGNSVDGDTAPGAFTFNQTGGTYSDIGTGTAGVGGLLVADEDDAVAFVNVSGGTFQANNAVASRFGDDGTATVTINGTGAMESSSALFSLGHYAGATGTMNVSGDGTFVHTGGDLRIGRSGTGNVTITENGSFTASGANTYMAYYTGSEADVTVDGGTFNANAATSTRIGNYGSATVTVTGTGVMNSSSGTFMVGGHGRVGSSSTLNVNGDGVVTSSAAEFGVGQWRDDVSGTFIAATGTVNVAGSGTLNHSGAVFSVGRSGVGTLNLSEDGDINLTGATVYIGRYYYDGDGGSGTVNMDGGTLTHSGSANTMWIGYDKEGVFNQTGGALEVARMRLADDARSTGFYSISGGSLKVNNFITGGTSGDGTFEVYGSGASSIEAANISFYDDTLRVVLDENGSTLMVADKAFNTSYNGQIDIRGVFELDTTGAFNGTIGSVYDIGWASDTILTNDTLSVFTVLSGTEFEMSILDGVDRFGNAGTGQMLQVTVIPEPATLGMLAFVGGAVLWIRRKFMI